MSTSEKRNYLKKKTKRKTKSNLINFLCLGKLIREINNLKDSWHEANANQEKKMNNGKRKYNKKVGTLGVNGKSKMKLKSKLKIKSENNTCNNNINISNDNNNNNIFPISTTNSNAATLFKSPSKKIIS